MPNFTINIPTGDLADTVAAFSRGWDEESGITRQQYAKREIRRYLTSTVKSYREQQQSVTEPGIDVT